MSPLRWDVLAVGFLFSLPVLALGMRGDLTMEEMTSRLPWCLGAGWAVVGLLRYAGSPRPAEVRRSTRTRTTAATAAEQDAPPPA